MSPKRSDGPSPAALYMREWRARNPGGNTEHVRRFYERHPEKKAEYSRKYRANRTPEQEARDKKRINEANAARRDERREYNKRLRAKKRAEREQADA